MRTVIDERLETRISQSETTMVSEMNKQLGFRFAKSEASILSKMDEQLDSRFAESEASMLSKMDEQLDSRFAESEASMLSKMDEQLDSRFAESEASILSQVDKRLDSRFAKSEAVMTSRINRCIAKSENLVLKEMERTRKILEDKIQNVQNNLDNVTEYYRITKLEHDNTTLLLRAVSNLEQRVEVLEQKDRAIRLPYFCNSSDTP